MITTKKGREILPVPFDAFVKVPFALLYIRANGFKQSQVHDFPFMVPA